MEILNFIFYTLGILVVIELALQVFSWYYLKENHDELDESRPEDYLILGWVEEINGMFYVYNIQNNAFVGQGRTVEDFQNMSERVGKQVVVMDGQPEAFEKLTNTLGIKEYKIGVK